MNKEKGSIDNMEKTALHQLIEKLEKQKEILKNHFEPGKWNEDRCSEIDNSIDEAKSLLPTEKQNIIDAFEKGNATVLGASGENYFNQKYNK